MSSLSDSLLQGYEKYYNGLINNGCVGIGHVNRLVIAGWINKVINGKYGTIPTDEQYAILDKLYQCVIGDCLVPYQKYCNDVAVNKINLGNYVRVTQKNADTRFLEGDNNNIRIL